MQTSDAFVKTRDTVLKIAQRAVQLERDIAEAIPRQIEYKVRAVVFNKVSKVMYLLYNIFCVVVAWT